MFVDIVVTFSSYGRVNAARWQASEELSTFLGTTRTPLSKFDKRQIVKDYPRLNVDAVFTPRLDTYLPGLMGGLTGPDAELRYFQDKVLDIMGPLSTAHEHLLDKLDAPSSIIQFSREEGTGLMAVIQRSIQLAGHASATISQKRRVAVLSKENKAYASLGKEAFPAAGKDIFGKGFESRLKERTETAKAITEAKKVGQQLFSPPLHVDTPTWHVEGHGATYDVGPAKDVGKPDPVFFNRGEGAFPHPQAKPQPTSEQRYVPQSFTSKHSSSTSSWTTQIFSEQLASYYGQPMGVGDYDGLQNRVSFSASPGSLASQFHVNSQAGGCSSRDRKSGSARSHPPSLLQHRWGIRQQYISTQQNKRWPPPGCKPKESKFLPEFPTFQNGENSHVTGPFTKRGFYGRTGLKRRLPHCPSLERPSKILEVQLEEKSKGFCMSPIWAGQCPQDIHQTHETHCGNPSELGDLSYHMSGRPSHPSRFRAVCQTPPDNSYESPREFVVYHRPKKSVLTPV